MGNKKKAPRVLAWKFLNADHRLRYMDGRELVAGETLRDPVCCDRASCAHDKSPRLCSYGFHASIAARDALRYATGMTHIARVEIGGEIVRGEDKLAGTTIRCLWIADAEKTLRLFAIACRWRQMGYRLRGREPSLAALWALDCAERFVLGETDEEERQAAADAAYVAAYAADADAAAAYAADAAYVAADAAYVAAYAADADAVVAAAYAADAADAAADAVVAAAYAADAAEKIIAKDELESALLALGPSNG